jgi:hypothetical protein
MSDKNFKTIEKNYKYKMLCYPKKGSNMTKKQNQEKYIDRLKIERFFALLKKFPNINHRHDRKTNTFMGSILMVLLNVVYMKL